MDKEIFDSVMQGIAEATAHARGEEVGVVEHRIEVEEVDVAALRRRLGMTQRDFAAHFGFSLGSVRNWEQGIRRPTGPARVLLRVIRHSPETVREAMRA